MKVYIILIFGNDGFPFVANNLELCFDFLRERFKTFPPISFKQESEKVWRMYCMGTVRANFQIVEVEVQTK